MNDAESAAALAVIQGWDWERYVFDDLDAEPKWRSLSEAMNLLAFEGHANPADAFLRLLADGTLMARGNYRWRAFRAFDHFGGDGNGNIPSARWRAMVNANPFDILDLPKLGLSKQEPADWNWRKNSCAIAAVSGDPAEWWESKYAEEHFSAWNIEVHCPAAETSLPDSGTSSTVGNDDCEPAKPSVPTIGHSRGRPPKYDWEGALAHVTAVANTPDGLETGPGAQAAIERLITDYFARTSNNGTAPCESEIRKRASLVMKAIEALKPLLSKVA